MFTDHVCSTIAKIDEFVRVLSTVIKLANDVNVTRAVSKMIVALEIRQRTLKYIGEFC